MDAHAANPGDLSWSRFEDFAEVVVYERTPRELIIQRACDADMVFTN